MRRCLFQVPPACKRVDMSRMLRRLCTNMRQCVFLQLPHDHAFVGRGQTTRPVTAKSGRSSGHFHDVGNGFATQPRKDTTVWLKGAITQACKEMLLGSPHLGHLRRYMPRPSSTRTSRSTCRLRWVAQSSSKLRRADDCSVV